MKTKKKAKTSRLKPIIRPASSLSRESLESLVREIQEILWAEKRNAALGSAYWNPEKLWDAEVLANVASALNRHGLAPTSEGKESIAPILPFKVQVFVRLYAYAEVEIQAETQVDAEIKANKIIEEDGGFDSNLVFEPDWGSKEHLRVRPVDEKLYVKRHGEIADESLYS